MSENKRKYERPIQILNKVLRDGLRTKGLRHSSLFTTMVDYSRKLFKASFFGESIVSNRQMLFEVKFYYGIPQYFLRTEENLDGTIVNQDFSAVLNSGSQTGSLSSFETRKILDFRVGSEFQITMCCSFSVQGEGIDQRGILNKRQLLGIFNSDDGYYAGFESDGDFSLFRKKDGSVVETIPRSDFLDPLDGSGPSEFDIRFDKINHYRIIYSWGTNCSVYFEVQGENCRWIPFYILNLQNRLDGPPIGVPNQPFKALCESLDNSPSVPMKVESAGASIIGGNSRAGRKYYARTTRKNVSSNENYPLIILRNKTVFNGKPNKLIFKPTYMSAAPDQSVAGRYLLIKNPTTITGASFADVDPGESICEVDFQATEITGGEVIYPASVGREDSLNQILEDLDMILVPGDVLVLVVNASTNNDVNAGIRWAELH